MRKLHWLLAVVAVALPGFLQAQETGTIRGTVVDATTMRPLSGAQVFIPSPSQGAVAGTSFGTLTDAQGRYMIVNVPAGQNTVRVQMLGYSADQQTVEVNAGQTATANFRINQTALELDEVVVTGVAGATPKAKLPFKVEKLQVDEIPVPAVTAASALQGKVAGVQVTGGTGQPGQTPSVLLRGATSINAGGRDQGPLWIVDGVIVSGQPNIDPLDIESIEVVKGAAAASLYGSRAANGVIQVQTKRGEELREGATARYTLRTEYGASSLANGIDLNESNAFLMNANQTAFIDAEGNEIGFDEAIPETTNLSRLFHDNPFPGQTFDQIDRFFNPGTFMQNYAAVEGRAGNTNYYGSFSNLQESGIVRFNEGFERQNFRLNLDHGLRDDLQLSLSTFYSTSWQDLLDTGAGADAFFNLTFVPPPVDLLEKDPETGEIRVNPNPRSLEDNPLYEIAYRDLERERRRFMGSALVRYAPAPWFDVEGNLSYDRENQETFSFFPKGFARGAVDPTPLTKGQIDEWFDADEAVNASVTGSLYRTFGKLTTKTKGRYLYETASENGIFTGGQELIAAGVRSLRVAAGDLDANSYRQDIRSEGYFLITSLDYDDKYILDALVRRDGSSLFGADERWQTYYRASGAWRMSQEPWFQMPWMNEFKLRASYGTAGGRPKFDAQYETYGVNAGQLVAQTLGNRELKPEFAREIEVGIDAEMFDRISLGLTYADNVTEDQILPVPLPSFAGFQFQWQNAGTLASQTWEASLEASLYQSKDVNWWARVLLDRTRTEIVELNVPAFQGGSSNAFFIREGELLGTIYGRKFATSCADLSPAAQALCGQFATNDDGFLVFTGGQPLSAGVGPDGIAGTDDDLWGTKCSADVAGVVRNSVGCEFGQPVYATCTNDQGEPTDNCRIGNTLPDLNFSFSSNFDWKGFGIYGLLDSSLGFDIYNQTIQWAFREERAGAVDQRGLAEAEKKPAKYFLNLYDVNAVNNAFVEDGSFVKLRELSLRYSFNEDQLRRIGVPGSDRITLALIGRNLLTFTDYTGYDPEVGNPLSIFGSASIDRFDGYQYPNFRTLTASVEVAF